MLGTDWGANRLRACLMGLMKKEKHFEKRKVQKSKTQTNKQW